jgi:general secretion pathway protein G
MQLIRIINRHRGFTLIEMVVVIIIIGILASIAAMKMSSTIETSKFEATRAEMDELARAIVGDAAVYNDGARSDFGYVGDIGALPPNLNALVTNPGFASWNGPYINSNTGSDDFKKDGWDVDYIYIGTLLRSVGSGSNMDKALAPAAALLNNNVTGYLIDADNNIPGSIYGDSLDVSMIYPDGSGSMATSTINPANDGSFSFANIPVGNHTLQVVFIPESDTIEYQVCVIPGEDAYIEVTFPADLW